MQTTRMTQTQVHMDPVHQAKQTAPAMGTSMNFAATWTTSRPQLRASLEPPSLIFALVNRPWQKLARRLNRMMVTMMARVSICPNRKRFHLTAS
jgi:hypothetical protein